MIKQNLVKLGLSSDEAQCYIELIKQGSLTTAQLAQKIGILPNAVYRLVRKLQERGFVTILNTYPVTFQAIPPSTAIESYVGQKNKEFEEIKINSIRSLEENQASTPTKVDIIVSQKGLFDKFIELSEQVMREILVISIGESVPDELKLACVRAHQRGIKIKFIFHVHNKENAELLKSWVKMGMEVRHFKDGGYHLNVYDGKIAILVTNNPKNTKERLGMVFYNERLANSLRDYFYNIWDRATKI